MLEGLNLSFRHDLSAALLFSDFTISVRAGENVGLTGPSGAGKTTVGRILAGYLTPSAGKVVVDSAVPPAHVWHPVQMLFQHPELAVNPRWKIADILEEAGTFSRELLPQLAISEGWLSRYPHEVSGGELQRICLARALGPQTRYLICDEMTSMLDALTQMEIWKSVVSIARRRGLGLLVISHDHVLLEKICDRVVAVDQRC